MSQAIRDDAKPNEIHLNADETPIHLDPNTLVSKLMLWALFSFSLDKNIQHSTRGQFTEWQWTKHVRVP